MGKAKHAPTTPANRLHSCKGANRTGTRRRSALASILALSTAAGASAILVGDALMPKPAAAVPADPDAHIHVFVARLLPEVEECHRLAVRMEAKRKAALTEIGYTSATERDECLARVGEFPRLADAFARHGYEEARTAWREAEAAVFKTSQDFALLRPVTLAGFIAKARVAEYQPYIALHIMRDLLAIDAAARA